jgi:hypothetical protein
MGSLSGYGLKALIGEKVADRVAHQLKGSFSWVPRGGFLHRPTKGVP